MKIKLIMVGKSDKEVSVWTDEYIKRLSQWKPELCIVKGEKKNKNSSIEIVKEREAVKVLEQVNNKEYVILLSEEGKMRSSTELADHLNRIYRQRSSITFVIGGAYGFGKSVFERANEILSLSLLTMTHQMVRIFFLEQLYRVETIIQGKSYHH